VGQRPFHGTTKGSAQRPAVLLQRLCVPGGGAGPGVAIKPWNRQDRIARKPRDSLLPTIEHHVPQFLEGRGNRFYGARTHNEHVDVNHVVVSAEDVQVFHKGFPGGHLG